MKKYFALAISLAACSGPGVELGGSQNQGVSRADAAPSNDGSTAPPQPTTSPTSATCGYPVQSTACPTTGSCSDGSGYLFDTPAFCSEPAGAQESFTSIAQVAAALVGTWSACTIGSAASTNFVATISPDGGAIQFGSDGHFTILGATQGSAQDISLVPGTDPGDSGTFDVIDASASLGAGTFQVRLSGADGGVHLTQVVVFGSPPRVRFFSPGASDYLPAPTKRYQANVCGLPFGPFDTPDSGKDALARMTGRWARCPNDATRSAENDFEGEGVEFVGDGTWYSLVENPMGDLVRSTDPLGHGTVAVAGSSPASLTVLWSTAKSSTMQPMIGECGTLGFNGAWSFEYVRLP